MMRQRPLLSNTKRESMRIPHMREDDTQKPLNEVVRFARMIFRNDEWLFGVNQSHLKALVHQNAHAARGMRSSNRLSRPIQISSFDPISRHGHLGFIPDNQA